MNSCPLLLDGFVAKQIDINFKNEGFNFSLLVVQSKTLFLITDL